MPASFAGNVFYSRNVVCGAGCSWDDANSWSNTGFAGAAAATIPTANSIVYIGSGHNVDVNSATPAITLRLVRIDNNGTLNLNNSGARFTFQVLTGAGTGGNGTVRSTGQNMPNVTYNDFATRTNARVLFEGAGFNINGGAAANQWGEFPNLTIAGTGTKNFNNINVLVNGILRVETGVTFNGNGRAFELRGGIANNGTFTGGTGTFSFTTSNQSITGNIAPVFGGNVNIANIVLTNNNVEGVTINGVLNGSTAISE